MIKRSVGRPKLLNREHVINTAFCEYWSYGINNVTVSKVAKIAGISRPGIYIEFKNEDSLKAEVLKKYIFECAKPVHKNYDNYKQYPNHLVNHLHALINDGGDTLLSDDIKYNNIDRPENAIGCLLLRSILNKFTLGPISQKIISEFELYRIEQFTKYIINAQKDDIINKNLDINFYARYLHWVFGLIQIMRLNGSNNNDVTNVINTALIPLFKERNVLNS